jgi:hypothetical protein
VVGWGEIEIKAKLSPAKAGTWAELGNKVGLNFALISQPKNSCRGFFSFFLKF